MRIRPRPLGSRCLRSLRCLHSVPARALSAPDPAPGLRRRLEAQGQTPIDRFVLALQVGWLRRLAGASASCAIGSSPNAPNHRPPPPPPPPPAPPQVKSRLADLNARRQAAPALMDDEALKEAAIQVCSLVWVWAWATAGGRGEGTQPWPAPHPCRPLPRLHHASPAAHPRDRSTSSWHCPPPPEQRERTGATSMQPTSIGCRRWGPR